MVRRKLLAGIGMLLLAACQAVAGIQERRLQEGAAMSGVTALCEDYCEAVESKCTGDNAVYRPEACLAVCSFLPDAQDVRSVSASAADDAEPNTIECRTEQVVELSEAETDCVAAGPSGGGVCGSKRDAYCGLRQKICGHNLKECEEHASLVLARDDPMLRNVETAFGMGGDTLQCRFAHLSAAALAASKNNEKDTKMHCDHADINVLQYHTEEMEQPCTELPSCPEYCDVVMAACPEDKPYAQYANHDECEDACKAFDLGKKKDIGVNTVGCRIFHAFSSVPNAAAQQCGFAGPAGGGDGGCGSNCQGFCEVLQMACTNGFMEDYNNLQEECVAKCQERGPSAKYSTQPDGSIFQCQMSNAVRAASRRNATLRGDLCKKALGREPCQ